MNKLDKEQEYGLGVADGILSLFRDEEDGGNQDYHYDLSEIDATKFFIGMVIGCNLVFEKLTQQEQDLIDFTNTLNKLAFQYLIEKSKEN